MSVITMEHFKYRYPGAGALALDDISLTIEKGEFIGIIGANGAGKSTLSQAIIGLVPQFYKGAYGGSVTVCGLNAEETPVSVLCEKVGLVFQNPFNQLTGAKDTVYGEVAFGMQNLGVEREEMKRRIEETLKLLDIWQYRDRNPFELSGGQMQRVAIASVLVMKPQVIILDEPTSQLDPEGTEEVFRVVDKLSKSGITIIMIEQKIEKLASYCDRLLLLGKGKQVAFDVPEQIFSRNDLAEYGIQAPAFARICRAKGITLPNGAYPVTADSAAQLLQNRNNKDNNDSKETNNNSATSCNLKKEASATASETFGQTVFSVKDLDFHYQESVPIFEQLNLTLGSRPTAIIGQNGAGKTTLVKLLKGLLKPVSGSIFFGNEDISQKTVAMLAGNVGYVFQNPDDQIFKYKVLDEILFGPLNIGMPQAQAKEKALQAMELTGLSGLEEQNPYDLELYQRKMVAIASVLAMDTDVIILDEPTIAQDYPGRKTIGSIIRALTDNGKLVIAILHDMDFVAEYFDRAIIMAHGRILADGNIRYIFSQDSALEEARLQKPYVTQLCSRLGYDQVYLTVEDFLRD